MFRIATPHLDIVAASLALLDAELESSASLASMLGVYVPDDWPPGEYDRPAIEHFRSHVAEHPEDAQWYSWYALLRSGSPDLPTLVGAGGFFGPPNTDGMVEIGYSIVPAFYGKGYATELVRALVDRAFHSGRVIRIVAHTTTANRASVRVLEKTGFDCVRLGEDRKTVEYVLNRPASR